MGEIGGQCQRSPYWEEMTSEQRIGKLAEVVESLGRRVYVLETELAKVGQHMHAHGEIVIPLAASELEQPWYKTHLLDRRPTC